MNLKRKVDCGVDFLTTQMFFDNTVLYNFLYRIREKEITVPVIPGIMPVTNGNQIKRSCELSGAMMPARFKAIVDKFGDNPKAMQRAGIAYATDQIIDSEQNTIFRQMCRLCQSKIYLMQASLYLPIIVMVNMLAHIVMVTDL